MAATGELPPDVLRHLIQGSCRAPHWFNIHALSQLCAICRVSRNWRCWGQHELRAALTRWGLRWDSSIWYGTPTLGWLGRVRENPYRSTDYQALDGGDDGLLSIRPTEKTNLRRSDHRRYIAEKFCKHGSIEQVLRLFSVLPDFHRLYPAPGGGHGFGYFFGDFYEHLEHLFKHACFSGDRIITRQRFPVVDWFARNWDGFFPCFEGKLCSYWKKNQVLDDCLGMLAATRDRYALRLWRQVGAQMVKHKYGFDRRRGTCSLGAWGEIFRSYSVDQEQLRLFEACVTAGPRFVRHARESREVATGILDALERARDDEQYARLARGIQRRRPFKDEALDILPQEMRPLNGPEAADSGGEDMSDDGPLPPYSDEEDESAGDDTDQEFA